MNRCSFVACVASAVACWSGCSWTDHGGTHHLILGVGFGIVTTTNRTGVEVRDDRVLGVLIGPAGAGVGWMRNHRVAINPEEASNTVVSIRATPLTLTVKNFDPYFTKTNQPNTKGEQDK